MSASWRPEIQGWSDDIHDFYETIIPSLPQEPIIAEIGTYQGRSALFLAERLHESGRGGRLLAIDPSPQPSFLDHLSKLHPDARAIVVPIYATSMQTANRWQTDQFDLVFIDGSHEYDAVKADLDAWWPLVKNGGIIAGHDFGQRSPYCNGSAGFYPGVERAVREKFGDQFNFAGDNSTVWWVRR